MIARQWIGIGIFAFIVAAGALFPTWAPALVDNPNIISPDHVQDIGDAVVKILNEGGADVKPFTVPDVFVTDCELIQRATICLRSSDRVEATNAAHISTKLDRDCRDYAIAFELTRFVLFKQGFVHARGGDSAAAMLRATLWQQETAVAVALIYGIDNGIPRCKPPRSVAGST